MDVSAQEAAKRKYILHPVKSELSLGTPTHIGLGGEKLPYVDSLEHLGLNRSLKASNTETINDRIYTVTGTLYARMPPGLHGDNGLTPHASSKILSSYVIPKLIYGLEALVLSKTDINNVERRLKQKLKTLLSLRDGTADEAIYLISGIHPLKAAIESRKLSLFGAITRLD